jgi:acetate---CoA ligase (ADP-forming)
MDDDRAARADAIRCLLAPRSVAIVGASADPGRIGGRPVRYYREGGFTGRLYPINPNRTEIQGYPAFPSLDAVPDAIEFALLAIPAQQVPLALEQCARKGAKAAVVFSAGFAEIGAAGAALQAELAATAARHGIRVLGPNCLGLFNLRARHFPTFTSLLETERPLPGKVGLVTQSGAYGSHLLKLAAARRIGINTWVSTGNEADIDVAEIIEALAADPETGVIACYLEGVHSAPSFMRALAAAHAARKPVIVMKVGRSAVGAAAAASHTASLAGSDAVFDAALRGYGVERVETTEQMLDLAYAMSRTALPRGNRLGIVTISGGAGVMMADAAEREGLAVPPMPEPVQQRLLASNPLGTPRNPVDITAQAFNDFGLVRDHIAALLEDGGYDCAAAFFTMWPSSSTIGPKLQAALREGTKARGDRPFVLVIIAPPDILASYEAEGFLVFEDPSRAIATLGAMARLAARYAAPPRGTPPALPAAAEPVPPTAIGEAEAKRLLGAAGIPLLPERLVRSAAEAAAAFGALGGPVAMKIVSPDIAHKTEVGGVVLDVASAEQATAAYGEILAAVAAKAPGARIDGVLVAPMARDGVELIVGARNDPVFGPVVMVGIGGIFVEVLRDVALRIGAIDAAEAHRMLGELKGQALLAGARGRAAADLDAAAQAIAALSVYALANTGRFESIEINPLLVRAAGRGAVALDALIVPAGSGG